MNKAAYGFLLLCTIAAGCMNMTSGPQAVSVHTEAPTLMQILATAKENGWQPTRFFDTSKCNRPDQKSEYWVPLMAATSEAELKAVYSQLGIDPDKVTTPGGVGNHLNQLLKGGLGAEINPSDAFVANCGWKLGR